MRRDFDGLRSWYDGLRDAVLKGREPASRTYRYLARLLERDFDTSAGGTCLAFFSLDDDRIAADTILLLGYCLRSELDSRVLLLDARVRDIELGLSGRLRLASAPGYRDALRNNAGDGREFIQRTAQEGVDVMPAGGGGAVVDRDRLQTLLKGLKSDYQHVLMQTGSVAADTRNLGAATQADAVFMVAQEHQTLMRSVSDCQALMHNNGIADVRVILAGETG